MCSRYSKQSNKCPSESSTACTLKVVEEAGSVVFGVQVLEQLLTDYLHRRRQAQTDRLVACPVDSQRYVPQQLQQGYQGLNLPPSGVTS